ncbi:unnamed protein product [Sphagnum tenellum]
MKTILITGTTSGIGKAVVDQLAQLYGPLNFILSNRDPLRSEKLVAELSSSYPNSKFNFEKLDLASLKSVRSFAERVSVKKIAIDFLVLNAGLQVTGPISQTEDGFETTFGVNHLGHFLLTRLLLSQMNVGGRIVVISSGTHDPALKTGIPVPRYSSAKLLSQGVLDKSDELSQGDYGKSLYSTSKLCNLMFGYELNRQLKLSSDKKLSSIDVLIFDPKMNPGTGLARTYPKPIQLIWKYLLPILSNLVPGARSIEKTAHVLSSLIMDDSQKFDGRYFDDLNPIKSSTESYDPSKWSDLWSVSSELCRIPPEVNKIAK